MRTLVEVDARTLTGPALSWAVAQCLKKKVTYHDRDGPITYLYAYNGNTDSFDTPYYPSSNWAEAGPIIDQEGIDLYCGLVGQPDHPDPAWRTSSWRAKYHRMGVGQDAVFGPTAIVAALRCFVIFHLGRQVKVPKRLLNLEEGY